MYSLASRYDNPFPSRFLSAIDCLKIPAQSRELVTFLLSFEKKPFQISGACAERPGLRSERQDLSGVCIRQDVRNF
jgi:hypothetical protein